MNATQRRWSEETRARAVALRLDERMGTAAIVDALRREHGADVPAATVQSWIRSARATNPPADVSAAIENLTARLVAVLAREVDSMERARTHVDLARAERLARSLSMLRREQRSRSPNGVSKARTLADLGTDEPIEASDAEDSEPSAGLTRLETQDGAA